MIAKKAKKSPAPVDRWAGVRTVCVIAPSPQESISRLVKKLDSGAALNDDDRRSIAGYLRSFASNEKAMADYVSQGPGRKRGSFGPEIALDYLIQKERLGKAAAAKASASKFWGISEDRVRDAYTDNKHYAERKLDEQLQRFVGLKGQRIKQLNLTEDMAMTREHVLKDCLMDLRMWADRQLGRNN